MFTKKFWLTFILVFVVLEATNYFFYMYLLDPLWKDPEVSKAFRPEEEMFSKMWLGYILDLIWSFFFTFFFAKGYENRGLMEGVRFGIYIGLFYFLVVNYGNYVIFPLPYKATLYPFLCGFAQAIILGIVAALVYKPKQETEATE
jgi:hypothetical protein